MGRVLLDTHAILWWLADGIRLGLIAREVIGDERNEAFVSAASSWEISIKRSLGKLDAPGDLGSIVEEEGFSPLAITFFHGERAVALALLHPDPFDRMLIAQAQAEGLEIVMADARLAEYGVRTINALRKQNVSPIGEWAIRSTAFRMVRAIPQWNSRSLRL